MKEKIAWIQVEIDVLYDLTKISKENLYFYTPRICYLVEQLIELKSIN